MRTFLFTLIGVLNAAVCAYGEPGFEVYSGYLESHIREGLQKNHPARLFLIRDSSEDAYLAILKLSHGGFDSVEYATYVYSPVNYRPGAERLDLELHPNAAVSSLPRIFLNLTNQGWQGVVQSLASDNELSLTLRQGWQLPDLPSGVSITQSLAGYYTTQDCRSEPGMNGPVEHRGMVLLPKRGSSEDLFRLGIAEAGMKMQNYVGALTVESSQALSSGQQTSGTSLRTGRYNFYNHTLEINFNSALLFCWMLDAHPDIAKSHAVSNQKPGDLWCRSHIFENKGCHYQRQRDYSRITSVLETNRTNDESGVELKSTALSDSRTVCSTLHGKWFGTSLIDSSQKILPTQLQMITRYDGDCVIYAQIEQQLYRSRPIRQRFVRTIVSERESQITLKPYEHSDMLLVLDIGGQQKKNISATWFSTIFGYVGELKLRKNPAAAVPLGQVKNPVFALAGFYDFETKLSEQQKISVVTRLFNAGVDVNLLSADPARMFGFNGYMEAYMSTRNGADMGSQPVRIVQMESLRTEYFDYFTNRFLIKTDSEAGRGYWFGEVTAEGLSARQVNAPFSGDYNVEHDRVFWKAR